MRTDILIDWIAETQFWLKQGETGLTGNLYAGLHEFEDMSFLLHFLRNEDLFVDVGANSGSYTLLACSVVGAHGIAFEPGVLAYQRLTKNVRLNGLCASVKCIRAAVGSRNGSVQFLQGKDTTNHVVSSDEFSLSARSVDLVSLDSALLDSTPTFIKVDVEGFEQEVLLGGQRILQEPSLLAVLLETGGAGRRYGYNDEKTVELMLDSGFAAHTYSPFDRLLRASADGAKRTGNTLFLRRSDEVRRRIRNGPAFEVHGLSI